MDHGHTQSRPPTRRRVLADASSRANEDNSARRRQMGKPSIEAFQSSSPVCIPHKELAPNGMLSVKNSPLPVPSPENKRLSAVINEDVRPHNPKRDSEMSNASTASGFSSRHKRCVGPWELGKTIGRGGCARVRVVRHVVTNQKGAAKIVAKSVAEQVCAISMANLVKSAQTDSATADGPVIPFGLEREICIMKLLDHPNIVRLLDVWENHNEL